MRLAREFVDPPARQDLQGVTADMERLGASPDQIEAFEQSRELTENPIQIHEDDAPTARLFLASFTQLRHAGMAGLPTGFDYSGVRAAADMIGIEITARVFDDFQAMEIAAIGNLVDRAKRRSNS